MVKLKYPQGFEPLCVKPENNLPPPGFGGIRMIIDLSPLVAVRRNLFKLRSIPANAVLPGSFLAVIVGVPESASRRAINIRQSRQYVNPPTNFDKHCVGANIDRWLPLRTETKAAAFHPDSLIEIHIPLS
ncbi:hypothetical protein B0H19DRAFT_1079672 [Mycena capillaripes]|nr:hypothetical protein B0H19DRAFT_1079672 [Mycena capillaripes]